MRNIVVIAILAVCLAAPVKASAFGFGDIIAVGRKLFKIVEPRQAPERTDEEKIDAALPEESADEWQREYKVWKEAYKKNDITPLFDNEKNFTLTEDELNYFAQKEYNSATSSIVRDLKVDLKPGTIAVSGYSMLNMFKGDFAVELEVLKGGNGLYLKVTKAKLGKIRVPGVILDNIVNREIKGVKNFLYSNKDHSDPDISISEDKLELKYAP